MPEAAEHLEPYQVWFEQKWVAPLVISLAPQQPPLGPGAGPGPTAQAGASTQAGKATAAATPG